MNYDQHTPGQDIIDLRAVLDHLGELEGDELDEYQELVNGLEDYLWTDIQTIVDGYDPILIHARYFTDYARELADDIGAIDSNADWPLSFIDWDAAADALKVDYEEVVFGGHDYYGRLA